MSGLPSRTSIRDRGLRTVTALLVLVSTVTNAKTTLAASADGDSTCLYQGADEGRTFCIRKEHFNADLCEVIDQFATARNIPSAFFARLIWRESLFRPEAVSPKGAEGIAQFMPATARRRGLANSFDVISALHASSTYLNELRLRFGNLGLAAAAYNAGESGLDRFLAAGSLPIETRDYVFAITGQLVETWRDNPPEIAAPELQEGKPFTDACIRLAETRQLNDPVLAGSADWAPWGVQLAAHYNPAVAGRLFSSSVAKLPSPLNAERALIVRQRGGNFGYRPRYAARIGKETRLDATKLCDEIRAAGVPCTVFKNL
ncbi:lytic transglycosylase domain-containing protein [Rhizobium sp. BK251]|uniref:lytic transglycosylase domain-containing protein n=1 Tax=Rhizobium sp. BK251 TaxID=2512125 RepID=UPI0010EF6578|nr:lytic transglycosylase domain-containing protein [Rhizobium sp. BK251]TCL73986.1 soluble lytic murein transglycosylase-like protein [Rhizobium sp. BK251]